MNLSKRTPMVSILVGIFLSIWVFGNVAFTQDRGRRHLKPPPEAYTACEGKSAGDKAAFVSPRGDTVTGTCEEEGNRLVLHPQNISETRGGTHPTAKTLA